MASRTVPWKRYASCGTTPRRWRYDGEVQGAQVRAVDGHPAAGRVVEAGDQLHQRRLARARLADEGDGLARRGCVKSTPPRASSARRRRPYAKCTSSKAMSPRRDRTSSGSSAASRGRRLLEQLLDAAQRDGGLLVAVEDLGELLDGGEEQVDVEEVGDQRAGRQRRRRPPGPRPTISTAAAATDDSSWTKGK